MYIENSINEKYIRTLNFGCFPKNVLQFQESQDYFQQLVFVDYQLQLLIDNEFNKNELLSLESLSQLERNPNSVTSANEKLQQLINYAKSISLNYENTTKSYDENLYYTVLMAHLSYLDDNLNQMNKLLGSVVVPFQVSKNNKVSNTSLNQKEFIEYLTVRYYVLLGLVGPNNFNVWLEYLQHYKKPFAKSQVVANHWLDLLFQKLALNLSKNATIPFSFGNHLRNLSFFSNKMAIIAFSNYLLRPENFQLINKSFKTEYTTYLTNEIEENILVKNQFPNANNNDSAAAEINDFINNLYESLSYVPFNLSILKPSLSKRYLVDATTKTYQSRVVLSNLIYTLIDLNDYDEALAVFKTYVDYSKKDQELKEGYIDDILSIIDTYSTCIIHFNPLKSFKDHKKFHHNDDAMVLEALKHFVVELVDYMKKLENLIDLSYDDENYASDRNPLSFLYRKYNINILQSDNSQFIELISKAWYAIGYYYYYLSNFESSNQSTMNTNVGSVLRYYKNSLIVNSTGNVFYLYSYALALANSGSLKSSLKLCKFILKKFPESFRTWNLLVLLLTSFDNDNADVLKPATNFETILPSDLTNGDHPDGAQQNGYVAPKPQIREPERFINKALNISGLYIIKHKQRDIKLTAETKYEILQLKLTQLAVLESIHGAQYMMDYLSEVFILYHELFDVQLKSAPAVTQSSRQFGAVDKWSHRPSFIDPSPNAQKVTHESFIPPVAKFHEPELEPKMSNHSKSGSRVDKLKRLSNITSKDSPIGRRGSQIYSTVQLRIKKPDLKGASGTSNGILKTPPSVATSPKPAAVEKFLPEPVAPARTHDNLIERKILQEIWLWTSRVFLKAGLVDECEQCIVEAESIYEPNIKTFTALGYLTSKSRKFLSLQEFERSLEILSTDSSFKYNINDYSLTLLGISKLFLVDDEQKNSLFISNKDLNIGLIRLKNLLEDFSNVWMGGYNNVEVWFYLSKIYQFIDDKILLTKSLWKCIDLEDQRPVRDFINYEL
ncbi:Cargo-transport protein YPP1 [Candida viswanathii]|uniref:Cargo-transport protein YPP1 n=1 Tax=Candida viswanathii TaxID=5486 RepID=A0A367XZJ1_9ASCO|nr:Cargo-transport protein YPP1 [Candida viswanathii]